MEIIETKFNDLKILGIGSEGVVYEKDNKAIKVFRNNNDFNDKYKKIMLMKALDFEFIAKPINFVSSNNIPVGYEMELIKDSIDLYTVLNDNTIDQKIDMLKKLEENIIELHKKHIVLVDCNLHNFLVRKNEIINIDIDNYMVGNLNPNVLPDYYYPYYSKKVTNVIDKNFDKFQMTLNAIEHLANSKLYKNLLSKYNSKSDYLEYYLKKIDINQELREFLLLQTSDSLNKEYVGKYLKLFKK